MNKNDLNKQLSRKEGTFLEPTIQVGKSGIEAVVEELKTQLKNNNMIKVRFLKSSFTEVNKKELFEKLAEMTGSELIEVRGNTGVFSRKR